MLKMLMLTSTIAFSGLIGLGAVYGHSNNDQQNETNHQLVRKERVKTDLKKNATYNDESYTITLTADELNTYVWDNFADALHDLYGSTETASVLTYTYNNVSKAATYYYVSNLVALNCDAFITSDAELYFGKLGYNSDLQYKFTLAEDSSMDDSTIFQFEYGLTILFNSTNYASLKTAIQADIDANQSTSMPSIADIFNEITSAVTAFVGSLGEAFESVTALFYDSTAGSWTFLGVLILIGVGVGLIYLAYRVIKGLMHKV